MKVQQKDILKPIKNVKLVDRKRLKPNHYNPNMVLEHNLQLLIQSILMNGWTMPIVVRPDMTIIDGFHRWTVSGREPLLSLTKGMVPVVIVKHETEEANVYGTITHNRARGTHLLGPMEKIIQNLINKKIPIEEISKQLGMRVEEVYRLSGMDKQDFLKLMTKGVKDYSRASKEISV
jgi:ParB-like chromosome segregation protein Spo0J